MITREMMDAFLASEGGESTATEIDGGWRISRIDMNQLWVHDEYVFSLLDDRVLQVFDGQYSVYAGWDEYTRAGD